jgi:hypothetical protein
MKSRKVRKRKTDAGALKDNLSGYFKPATQRKKKKNRFQLKTPKL